jgi:hypothetical protein
MSITYITLALGCLCLGAALVFLHIRTYLRLFYLFQARGLPVDDLYLKGFDYGSRGCVPKLKVISERLRESGVLLTEQEQTLMASSKSLYCSGGLVAVVGFFLFVALSFFVAKQ